MPSIKMIFSAALTMAVCSLPALAGEPGTGFYSQSGPAPAAAPHPHHGGDCCRTHHEADATRDLNIQSLHTIRTVQPTPVVTTRYYSAPPATTSGCYTPNPCATTHATVTHPPVTTTTRTVTRVYRTAPQPVVTYSAPPSPPPAPVATPCYVPNPCAAAPAPVVTYQQLPAHPPVPVPYPTHQVERYDWLAMEQCREDTIRRLPNTRDGDRQYSVCYSDLMHLSAYDRNVELLDRIETASRRACRDQGISSFYSSRARRSCQEDATEDAVYSANLPGLVDLYNYREHGYTPNVEVGRPIYN